MFLAVISSSASDLTPSEIKSTLDEAEFGRPLLAISSSLLEIVASLLVVVALCIILVLTTFLIPALVAYLYVPLFLALMLLISIIFLVRYFGQTVPFLDSSIQDQYAQKQSYFTLVAGVLFLLGFLASIITLISKRGKFKNIVPVLQISKACFWDNFYLLFASILFSALSIAALTCNVMLLQVSQVKEASQHYVDQRILTVLIVVEALWTHGVLEALSDFFFQSVAIHWYFGKRREIDGETHGCCYNLCQTIKLIFIHCGSITFGHIRAYIPETLNTMLGRCENRCGCCYSTFCCLHKITFRRITKYCFSQTILQSLPFCAANQEMFGLRKRTKATLPELYMMGNFYLTLAKIFIILTALILNYLLLIQNKEDLLSNFVHLIAPMVVTLFGSLEIACHFMNATGEVGDTIAFMYTADLEIEKKHFGEMIPNSCPEAVREIIHQIKAG